MSGLDDLPISIIKTRVCREMGVDRAQIDGRRRTGHLARARQLAMWLACETTTLTHPQIGLAFRRDHTTIEHGRDRTKSRMIDEPAFAALANEIRKELRERFMGVLA